MEPDEHLRVIALADREPVFPGSFTPAEREVARLVFDGASNAEIATARGTSDRTVAKQVSTLLHKAGVQSRVQLVRRLLGLPVDAG